MRSSEPEWLQDRIFQLATITDPALPGWSRTGFSELDFAGRLWIEREMRLLGLETKVDAVGNVTGYLEGEHPAAPDIVIGSHSDTVPGGGRFDGVVGIIGALEVVRMLRRSGIRLAHGLRVIDFSNEEGNPQGVKLVGSRAITGSLDRSALSATDDKGVTLSDLMRSGRRNPDEVKSSKWDPRGICGYLELHIEQGPILESENASVGIVSHICGINTFIADIQGRRDHGGTMPMDRRSDAMCGAAEVVLAVQRIAAAGGDSVGTVGAITTPSPLTNTISEQAKITGEFRSSTTTRLDLMKEALAKEIDKIDQRNSTRSHLTWKFDAPAAMDERLSSVASAAASYVGHSALTLYSGATHDSVEMAKITPTAMIFVPSKDGRSHCQEEWTEIADISKGVDVLAQSVILWDQSS